MIYCNLNATIISRSFHYT